MGWKNWKVGDLVRYSWNDFDGSGSLTGVVDAKFDDHLIVKADGIRLWVDDSNKEMFRKEKT